MTLCLRLLCVYVLIAHVRAYVRNAHAFRECPVHAMFDFRPILTTDSRCARILLSREMLDRTDSFNFKFDSESASLTFDGFKGDTLYAPIYAVRAVILQARVGVTRGKMQFLNANFIRRIYLAYSTTRGTATL